MTAPPALPVTIRPYLARRVIVVLGVIVTAVIGFVAFAPPAVEGRTNAFSTTDRVGMIGTAAIVLAGLWLLNRPKIRADANGMEVTNVFRSRRLEWAQVVGVSMSPNDPWLVLDLDDGTTMSAMAVQTSDGRRARAAAEQVRALVVAHTATPDR